MKSIRITLLAGLAALAAAIAPAAARPAPAGPLPAPTGAAPVGTLVLRLVDTSRVDPFAPEPRARELLLRFWYPAAGRSGEPTPYFAPRVAALYADQLNIPTRILTAFSVPARTNARPQAGRHPVVLFSPGFGVPSSNYALLLDDLASHGYVVLAIDHPYEAPLVFPGGRLVPPTLGDNGRDNTRTPPVRLRDARFVLDHLAALDRHGALAGRLDLTRIAMIGHSQGGATAASLMLADHRVAAGADIDGSLRGRVERVALDRPFLLVRADRGPRNDWFLHTIEFRKRQRGPLVTATFADVQHMGFSDYLALVPRLEPQVPGIRKLVPIGRADPVRTLAAQRGVVRAFLDTYLRDRPATLPGLGYPGVRITARAGS